MLRRFLLSPVSAVLLILLAACGGNGGEQSSPITVPPAGDGDRTVTTTTPPAPSAPTPAQPTPTAQPVACAVTKSWGTDVKKAEPFSTAPIYLARIGQHECYDRVVFDLNGADPVGYQVGYVPVVTAGGSGQEIPVEGGAALQIVIRASTQGSPGDNTGHQPGVVFAPSGRYLHGPSGLADWEALRAVRSAGWFEGYSTFAIGVRDRLPFRVTTWAEDNHIMHVIVDIAHH